MHIYWKSWVSLIPPISIQHHGAHCRKFASFSDMRNLILNILNLFTYFINSLIWNPFLFPPSLPTWTLTSLQLSYPGLGYAHRMGTCSASLGFSTLCWWSPVTDWVLPPLRLGSSLVVDMWNSHPGWLLPCLIWALTPWAGPVWLSPSGTGAYLTLPTSWLQDCVVGPGRQGKRGRGKRKRRVMSILNSKIWNK